MSITKCLMFICSSWVAVSANAADSPVPFIDPCQWNDDQCVLASAKKALPYLVHGHPSTKVPSLDPLEMHDLNGDNGEFKLFFKYLNVTELSKCEIIKAVRSTPLKVELELVCPIKATGKYKIGGKLLFVDVEGEDDCEITTAKLRVKLTINLKKVERDGEVYIKITGFDYTYDAEEKVYLNLYNLFHGDKAKAEPIHALLDQSWKEIFNEIAKPVMNNILTQCITGVGHFFHNVPCKYLEKSD